MKPLKIKASLCLIAGLVIVPTFLIPTLGTADSVERAELARAEALVVDDLRAVFNTKVNISQENNGKGKIVIPFKSDNDLKRILDLLDA